MNRILRNQSNGYKLYICLTLILLVLTFLLNWCSRIITCSLVITFLALTTNSIAALQGRKKAMISVIGCISTSFAVLHNMKCYIAGKPINGLILASLLCVLVSSYIGLKVFLKLRSGYSFAAANFISLLCYSLVDTLAMSIFFMRQLPINRVRVIFIQDTTYKCLFSITVYLALMVLFYIKRVGFKKYLVQINSIKLKKQQTPPKI